MPARCPIEGSPDFIHGCRWCERCALLEEYRRALAPSRLDCALGALRFIAQVPVVILSIAGSAVRQYRETRDLF